MEELLLLKLILFLLFILTILILVYSSKMQIIIDNAKKDDKTSIECKNKLNEASDPNNIIVLSLSGLIILVILITVYKLTFGKK